MDGELDKVQDCFMTVQLCVRDRGGMLRQFIVDDKGVVAIAFFGVRGSSFEDNEYRAVRFTLAVVRALKRLDVDAYCGITVGKGFCGLVGAPNRCEYAVMGPTVNLAARLMAAASKKQSEPIFVDERVSRAARQSQSTRHVFTAMEPIKAKGFAEPVKVFALAESERDRGRVTASAAHEAQVPFTGREKLLASIDGIVEAAAREDESASPQPDSPGSPRSPLSPKRLLETMGQSTRKLVATTSSASAGALFPGRASSPSGSSRSLKALATPSPRTSPSLRLRSLSGPPKSDDPESVVRLVCVDGESGLGKSRLLREIAEKHGGAWDVVEASADAVTLQRPFAIWINVIRSLVYARHGGRSPRAADVVRALAADAVGRRRGRRESRKRHSKDANPKPSLSRALSTKLRKASGALAGAGDDDTHSLSRFIRERMTKSQVAAYGDRLAFLDGDGMDSPEWTALNKSFKLEILAAAIAALAAPSRRAATRRTLLLIDNGHWLDFPSWELLEELVTKKQSHVGPAQVVVVLTKRGGVKLSAPNVWDNLMATHTTTTLSLDPLGAAASCKLLCAALDIPGHSVTPGTVDNVLRKCAGIPVLILALVESIEKHVKQAEAGIEDTVLEGETLSSEMSEETLAVVKSALQKVPCFINLDDEAKFKHVASRMVRIDCAPGKTLITKGEKGSTIYVLESGAMECVVDGVKVSDVSAGDVIGERAMLTNSARTATVSAATDTVLWSLERRDARFLVKEADYVWRRVLALESLSIPTRGDSSFMMPSSMAGIITNRLDTLSLNATTVVKLASAFGPVFHEEALRTCFPGPKRSKSADAIAELASDAPGEDEKERDECDSENGAASPSGLYRFKNQQIAEVIYAWSSTSRSASTTGASPSSSRTASRSSRARGRRTPPETKPALLSVITALHLGRSDLHLLLADHYTRSKSNEDKAMAYSLVAAKGATTLGLYREAEQLYRGVASQKVARKTALSPKEIKITESARLQSYIELAELYARFEMEPRPREDAEASPLGESSAGATRAGTALDHQFALQLTESCFAHSIRLSKVAGDKLAAADALNGFGTFYQLCASQVGELHATLGDTIRPSPAPAGRRLARSASQGEIPPAVVAAAKADEPPKGADHDDEPPRAGDGKKSANRYKRTNTDATPENLKPPTPPGEHRSLLRFSRLLLLSRPDLWSIAEDKLMESYDIRESSCVEGKPSLDVAQVCVTLGSLQMDMSKIDAARRRPSRRETCAYYALALHMYESELGPLHPRTAHAPRASRIANQGTKLITDPTPTTRRAGALILDEAIDYQARAVKARSALGQRHGTYRLRRRARAMELQRAPTSRSPRRSADSPYQPGRAQRRKSSNASSNLLSPSLGQNLERLGVPSRP
ncbi:cGMP-dependent protein kinase [Aureococcus anophagefferens]|nr:cGMP-dependent protein kinase [Aureococcus anophagefferens]